MKGAKDDPGARYICRRLAQAGYDAFSIDYRLLPDHPYPDALRDLQSAVEWLRRGPQVERFDLDPGRIGGFGESAGAVLVAEDGTAGSGSLSDGARLRAVVGLSTASTFQLPPSEVSGAALQLALQYLGCTSLTRCMNAKRASALAAVDGTDPPFLLAAAEGDWIPVGSTTAFAAALKQAGVPVQTRIEPGDGHGLQLVDGALMTQILRFYARYL